MCSQNTPSAEQPLFDDSVKRTTELHSLYTMFSVQYQSMDAVARRYFDVTLHGTTKPDRALIFAKFSVAAILDWQPTSYNFSTNLFLTSGSPVYKTDTQNEVCPYWVGYFDDLTEVAASLERLVVDPNAVIQAEKIEALLESAEIKAGWCESLLQAIRTASAVSQYRPRSEGEVYATWNRFCVSMIGGADLTESIEVLRSKAIRTAGGGYGTTQDLPAALPTELTAAEQARFWMSFEMTEKPWMNHAAAILQQPTTSMDLAWFHSPSDTQVQQWRLASKPCELGDVHFDCSTRSPCCSFRHVHCANPSPSRIWGADDCLHVRGDVVCLYPMCALTDWSRYIVCISR